MPPSKTFLLVPGEMTSVELMLGFRYEVRANNSHTVDITHLSPDNVDFHIEVE